MSMKTSLFLLALGLVQLSSAQAQTPVEKQIASCSLYGSVNVDSPVTKVGTMAILSSDNGDEGFLRFAFSFVDARSESLRSGEFTDNVQDDGAVFLKSGSRALYIPNEGARWNAADASPMVASVFLENNQGKITGRYKIDFAFGRVTCKQTK